jgi:hypothetical protein
VPRNAARALRLFIRSRQGRGEVAHGAGALEHAEGDFDVFEVVARGDDGRLMAILRQARDLSQTQLAAEQPDLLVGEHVAPVDAIDAGGALVKAALGHATRAPLAIGQDVEALRDDLLEEARAPATAIEHDGDGARADQLAHFVEHGLQHLDHAGVGFGRDDEQRLTRGVVDPIVAGSGQSYAHARHVRFGKPRVRVRTC